MPQDPRRMVFTLAIVAFTLYMCKVAANMDVVDAGTVGQETCRDSCSLLQGGVTVATADPLALVATSPRQQSSSSDPGSNFYHEDAFHAPLSLLALEPQAQSASSGKLEPQAQSASSGKAQSAYPGQRRKPSMAKIAVAYVAPFILIVFAWLFPWMYDRGEPPKQTTGKVFEGTGTEREQDRSNEQDQQNSRSAEAATEQLVDGNSAATPANSLLDVVLRIGPLWPLSILSALSGGVSGPSSGYIGLNFFAQHHTDMAHKQIHCELDPSALHCRQAVIDITQINMWVGLVAPFVQVLLGPALGALSDAYGRRPVLVICSVLSILPNFAVASFMYFDTSLYASYWMVPLADIPSGAVSYAYAVDRIKDPTSIASAFGVLTAASSACRLVGMAIGSRLSLLHAFSASFIMGLVSLTWVVFVLPESLMQKHRQPLERNFLIPGFGLKILVRNPLLARLAYVAIVAHFVDSGFNSIAGSYLQLYLNWTAHDNYISSILAACSSIIWLALGMSITVRLFGEVGVLNLSRWACLAFGITFLISSKPWQIFAIQAIFSGPITLGFPTVAALKGQSVSAAEQGLMQGALNTVTCVAGSVAPLAFGIIFTATNDPTPGGHSDKKQTIIYGLALTFPLLITLLTIPWLVRKYIVLPRQMLQKLQKSPELKQ